jgi:molecular chaperone GrpE
MMPKDPEDILNNAGNGTPAPQAEDSVGENPTLAAAEQKAAEYLASWQRTQADFINYKRRTEQERQDFILSASAGTILGLLPVLDDLERALGALPEAADEKWAEGVRLVERKFKAALEAQGVKPILALGMTFDPKLHEAVRQDKGAEGVVIGVMEKGYLINDRLLRPAKVVVGNGTDGDVAETPEQ